LEVPKEDVAAGLKEVEDIGLYGLKPGL